MADQETAYTLYHQADRLRAQIRTVRASETDTAVRAVLDAAEDQAVKAWRLAYPATFTDEDRYDRGIDMPADSWDSRATYHLTLARQWLANVTKRGL